MDRQADRRDENFFVTIADIFFVRDRLNWHLLLFLHHGGSGLVFLFITGVRILIFLQKNLLLLAEVFERSAIES